MKLERSEHMIHFDHGAITFMKEKKNAMCIYE
jgi:hypothetical protein